jgi:cysteine desulfurase
LSVAFPGVDASRLLQDLAMEVAASAGAACHSDGVSVSHVLEAMGVAPDLARATVRLSVGRFTTGDEIEDAVRLILGHLKG